MINNPHPQPAGTGRRYAIVLVFIITAFTAAGCPPAVPPPEFDPAAERLANRVLRRSEGMGGFKGIGKLNLRGEQRSRIARTAFAVKPPDKLRFEVLGAAGRPAVSVAADGDRFYFVSHPDGVYRKHRRENPSLEKIIFLPVSVKDAVALLGGNVPEREYYAAAVTDLSPGIRLTLLTKRRKPVLRILLSDMHAGTRSDKYRDIQSIEVMSPPGTFSYRAAFDRFQTKGDRRLPYQLHLTDGKGAFCRMTVSRFWTDTSLPPAVFSLSPP